MSALSFQRRSAFLAPDSHQKVDPNSCDINITCHQSNCEHGGLTRPPSNNFLQIFLQDTIPTNRQLEQASKSR